MRDTDREQIERGIASIGYFDIENCTCDPSVGVYPCHYCAEREAIVAGKRVVQRLAAAEAAMKAVASLPGENWLTGQLALAEFLDGKGGKHLQYALVMYRAAKGGRDE